MINMKEKKNRKKWAKSFKKGEKGREEAESYEARGAGLDAARSTEVARRRGGEVGSGGSVKRHLFSPLKNVASESSV